MGGSKVLEILFLPSITKINYVHLITDCKKCCEKNKNFIISSTAVYHRPRKLVQIELKR